MATLVNHRIEKKESGLFKTFVIGNTTSDDILWELTQKRITINELTKDQRNTLANNYGESWKSIIHNLIN